MNILVIPAAGRGTRLQSTYPKLLHPVAGRPMIDYIIRRYKPVIDRFILVINPLDESAVRSHLELKDIEFSLCFQHHPTGMLDALLQSYNDCKISKATRIWISWCDQIGISKHTVSGIISQLDALDYNSGMVLPVVEKEQPYIHFMRNKNNKIIRVLQQREGDKMPDVGENDCGLFAMTADVFLNELKTYSETIIKGDGTGERNFLPFIPWYHANGNIRSFRVENHLESIGVNDQSDLNTILDSLESF